MQYKNNKAAVIPEPEPISIGEEASENDSECLDNREPQTLEELKEARESTRTLIRLIILENLVIEKCVDIFSVLMMTGLVVNWAPLYGLIRTQVWISIVIFPTITMLMFILRRFVSPRSCSGYLVLKLVYLIHRAAVMLQYERFNVNLDWYFGVIAGATEGTLLILFLFNYKKVDGNRRAFWLYRFIMPIVVVVVSQPIYFCSKIWRNMDYELFMANIGIAVVIALLLSYEPVLMFQRYMDTSPKKVICGNGKIMTI